MASPYDGCAEDFFQVMSGFLCATMRALGRRGAVTDRCAHGDDDMKRGLLSGAFFVSGSLAALVASGAFVVLAPICAAQEAADPQAITGDIDVQESGLLAKGVAATGGVASDALAAVEAEARSDLGIAQKPAQNPTFFAAPPTAASTATAAAQPSAAPTLDDSNASIESDIEKLREDARE